MRFAAPIPILRIFDEARAREFYVDLLGFETTFEHRFEPGTPIYIGLKKGDCELHLSEHSGDGTPGTRLRIAYEDLEGLRDSILAARYKYARPGIETQPWGMDELAIADNFGNVLIFCRDTPGEEQPSGG